MPKRDHLFVELHTTIEMMEDERLQTRGGICISIIVRNLHLACSYISSRPNYLSQRLNKRCSNVGDQMHSDRCTICVVGSCPIVGMRASLAG